MNLWEWLPFIFTFGLPFDLYLAMQIIVLIRFRGILRLVALLPLPVMGYVIFLTARAYSANSNLWPIYLIVVSIPAFLFLVVLFFVEKSARNSS